MSQAITFRKKTVLITAATVVGEAFGDEPDFAWLLLSDELVARLKKFRNYVKKQGLSHICTFDSVDWGPNECCLVEDSMAVASESFWFSAQVKHGGYAVQTDCIFFNELWAALKGDTMANRSPSVTRIDTKEITFLVFYRPEEAYRLVDQVIELM